MNSHDTSLSKRLSLVLRHRPDSIGLVLDAHGWVPLDDLLAALAAGPARGSGGAVSRDDVLRVVAASDKQRFEHDPATDLIRARQGHSVPVDLDLAPATPPAVLFHGTPRRNLDSILATGLDRRRRHHVHLSPDRTTAERVGARRGAYVVLRVDAAAMAAAGHTFWRTGNGVWLADAVPAGFLALDDAPA
ncbi:RNA 2'-phosphotransferase [Pimelobacter simplex]|uniref:RNA 2'-phosphotransferase n=1 Tax=Nocardioides simplex TaxID=2045 RepID=UPI00214FD7C5|nr:RNA 2'-phosphotransferase [Pimelobacter simplex]UUW87380.1 RNA 2'-phosphotransferase [Pimelobacter simplex]UUW96885.1 RNA 2'-phosphotransferase [Pimelobacter simplex]